MLELKNASVVLSGRPLFTRLSLVAADGQLTCITGPSGVGKTVLARVMLGLQPLSEGLVSIDGELLTPLSAPVFRRLTVYVPQRVERMATTFVPLTSDLDEPLLADGVAARPPAVELGVPGATELQAAAASGKRLVVADAPAAELLEPLRQLAGTGLTVVVLSRLDAYLKSADKLITLETHDSILS